MELCSALLSSALHLLVVFIVRNACQPGGGPVPDPGQLSVVFVVCVCVCVWVFPAVNRGVGRVVLGDLPAGWS